MTMLESIIWIFWEKCSSERRIWIDLCADPLIQNARQQCAGRQIALFSLQRPLCALKKAGTKPFTDIEQSISVRNNAAYGTLFFNIRTATHCYEMKEERKRKSLQEKTRISSRYRFLTTGRGKKRAEFQIFTGEVVESWLKLLTILSVIHKAWIS